MRSGARRVVVAGRLATSSQQLTHEFAGSVTGALAAAGVDVFIVDRSDEHLVFGVVADSRPRAWDALRTLAAEDAWYVDWERGRRRGTVELTDRALPFHLRRSTSWAVYRAWANGDRLAGPEQATVITFWEIGDSGKQEMIGERGQSRFDVRSPSTVETIDGRQYPGRSAFPIGNRLDRFSGEVDVVYTWVDDSDPRWRADFDAWSQREQRDRSLDRDLVAGRYRDNDELRHSLRSLWFGCDWIRRIFVVTADQVPTWLDTSDPRISVVSHRDILPERCLPTFNSHAIEAALHRIDGLSEHFVYFNDDVFVGRPLRPDRFFTSSGLPKVFFSDARVPGVTDDRQIAVDNAAMRGRQLLARDFGRVAAFKPHHAPFSLRRSLLDDLSKRYADQVESTMRHRFRHPDDLSVPASLAQNYALAVGQAVTDSLAVEYVNLESGRLQWHLDRLKLGRRFDVFCLNETEVVAGNRRRAAALVAEFLTGYFPVPAPWERKRSST